MFIYYPSQHLEANLTIVDCRCNAVFPAIIFYTNFIGVEPQAKFMNVLVVAEHSFANTIVATF